MRWPAPTDCAFVRDLALPLILGAEHSAGAGMMRGVFVLSLSTLRRFPHPRRRAPAKQWRAPEAPKRNACATSVARRGAETQRVCNVCGAGRAKGQGIWPWYWRQAPCHLLPCFDNEPSSSLRPALWNFSMSAKSLEQGEKPDLPGSQKKESEFLSCAGMLL
jgi:hypothetical protein